MALALQEGFGAIIAKSLASIIWNQAAYRPHEVVRPLFWVFWVLVVFLSTLSMVFLKLVYARYEATVALPIEYGSVHTAQILGNHPTARVPACPCPCPCPFECD